MNPTMVQDYDVGDIIPDWIINLDEVNWINGTIRMGEAFPWRKAHTTLFESETVDWSMTLEESVPSLVYMMGFDI